MNKKLVILYDLIFKSIKQIITQNNGYSLNFITITIDDEFALLKVVKQNFIGSINIICLYFFKKI